MIRRPPRSTLDRSSAASDVYKRQRAEYYQADHPTLSDAEYDLLFAELAALERQWPQPVSYTHLRAHETVLDLVCRLLLEKKKAAQYLHGTQE